MDAQSIDHGGVQRACHSDIEPRFSTCPVPHVLSSFKVPTILNKKSHDAFTTLFLDAGPSVKNLTGNCSSAVLYPPVPALLAAVLP